MVAVRFFSIPLFSRTFLAVRGEQADFCPFTKKSTVSWMAGKKEGVGCELRKGREMVRIDYYTTQWQKEKKWWHDLRYTFPSSLSSFFLLSLFLSFFCFLFFFCSPFQHTILRNLTSPVTIGNSRITTAVVSGHLHFHFFKKCRTCSEMQKPEAERKTVYGSTLLIRMTYFFSRLITIAIRSKKWIIGTLQLLLRPTSSSILSWIWNEDMAVAPHKEKEENTKIVSRRSEQAIFLGMKIPLMEKWRSFFRDWKWGADTAYFCHCIAQRVPNRSCGRGCDGLLYHFVFTVCGNEV